MKAVSTKPWSPESFRQHQAAQQPSYLDAEALARSTGILRSLPPLVTAWEVQKLKATIADAQRGKRFWLQGGDCAETFAECTADVLTNKFKIMLQMSLVLIHGTRLPVVRVGRMAGQYAKPRSSPVEKRTMADGSTVELPSYFGDLINHADFTPKARRADPELLVTGHQHAAMSLNFLRSLSAGGFADLQHPQNWDLAFFDAASLPPDLRAAYQRTTEEVGDALKFMEALGEARVEDLSRVDFFVSHEALVLEYEAAHLRAGLQGETYLASTHLPWIGERTRALDGAHIELLRGVANPIGVKLGPKATSEELLRLCETLNPNNEMGKLVFIPRLGRDRVLGALPGWLDAMSKSGQHVLWVSDPMHGNTQTLSNGQKTRVFEDVLSELEQVIDVFKSAHQVFGGVHFELTGDDVTECLGAGLSEADLSRNYSTACDPRLNYRQALELAFRIAQRLRGLGRSK